MIEVQTSYPDSGGEDRSHWPVLIHAPLLAGYDRAALSRYGDDPWDLEPAVFRENVRRCHCTVRFDTVMATAMRAYLHARLNVRIPAGRRPCHPLLPGRHSITSVRSSSVFATSSA